MSEAQRLGDPARSKELPVVAWGRLAHWPYPESTHKREVLKEFSKKVGHSKMFQEDHFSRSGFDGHR